MDHLELCGSARPKYEAFGLLRLGLLWHADCIHEFRFFPSRRTTTISSHFFRKEEKDEE
jgi:hypothetical protein